MSHFRFSTLTTMGLAVLLSASLCQAQSAPEPHEVLIFGDVTHSGVFQVQQLPSVNEFVARAGGLLNGTASVRVVRDSKVVWAANVSKDQPCNVHVEHGDMLAVHSLKRMSGGDASKAVEVTVINSETRPLIVTLERGKVTTSQVLSEVRMANRQFRVVRTDPRLVPVDADANTVLEHGDILMVGDAPVGSSPRVTQAGNQQSTEVTAQRPATAAPGTLLIPISEQTITPKVQPSAMNDDTAPIPVAADYGAADTAVPTPALRPSPGQGIASPQHPTGVVPSAPQPPMAGHGEASEQDLLNTDPWAMGLRPAAQSAEPMNTAPTQFPNTQPHNDIPPFNGGQPANGGAYPQGGSYNTMRNGTNSFGAGSIPPGMPGGQPGTGLPPRPMDAQSPQTTAAAAANSSLPLPSELDVVVKDSSNATMWYVAGLAGALLLVLGAWVYGSRAMADTPQVRQDSYKRPVSRRHSTTVKHQPVAGATSAEPASASAAPTEKPRTPTIKPITAATPTAVNATPAPMAAVPVSSPAAVAIPVQGMTPPAIQSPPVPMSMPVPPANPAPQYAPVPQPMAPPAAPPMSIHDPSPMMNAQVATRMPTPPPAPEPIPVPNTSTTRILDSLINNSIPVSEQPVQLPTHLEFFGDSSGPKQLRIDPAQPELRGPHTGIRAARDQQHTTNQAAYEGQ